MFSRNWLALAVVLSLATSTYAQKRAAPGQLEGVDLQGKIRQKGPGMFSLVAATGQVWTVKIPPSVDVKVTGTAEPDMLPGAYIRFDANVDRRKSQGTEKVSHLTIFTPSQKSQSRVPGVRRGGTPPAEQGPDAAEPGKIGPKAPHGKMGPGPVRPKPKADAELPLNPDDLLEEGPAKKTGKPAKKRSGDDDPLDNGPPPNVDVFEIRGQVMAFKNGKLTVAVPPNQFFKTKVTVELAEDATIEVDLSDLTFVKPGDEAKVRGFYSQLGNATAQEVEITLVEPLTRLAKKAKRPKAKSSDDAAERPTRGKAKTKPKAAAEEEEQPPAKKPDEEKPAGKDAEQKPAEGAKEPAADGDKPEQIRKLIELPNQQAHAGGLEVTGKDGQKIVFQPSKPEEADKIREKFGMPDSVSGMQATLNTPEGQKQVKWKIWVYGPLTLLVDEGGKLIFYNWTRPEDKPKAPDPAEEKPKEEKPKEE